ncbi:MAG: ErfK/YbiS/YcfS/YnhG family [Geobacteraceae bacterium]|nr:MAG: ErfK/YbiS/YcfS/YnhG family [Geobacteraceae bacterium]
MLKKVVVILALISFVAIVIYEPEATSEPAANPRDPAKEDLSRVEYPSLAGIRWEPRFIMPNDDLESMFGKEWVYVARFNRIDRRHTYPGMTIKAPERMGDIRNYTPMPPVHEPARRHDKYILIDLTEQWLGAYEFGRLKFSMPAATGSKGHETPVGLFRVDARHRNHTSSLYKTEDQTEQYPMDNAIRFHVGADNVSYWIHARDLPGRPASHGCVGVYDEEMQNRVYGIPEKPVLLDSEKLYSWAVGEDDYEDDTGELEELEDGPVVEVAGENPRYLSAPLFPRLVKR